MKKRVLLLGNHPPPFGGVPTHIEDYSPYLARRGWHVTVAMVMPDHPRGLAAREERDGYVIHRITPQRILWAAMQPMSGIRAPWQDWRLLLSPLKKGVVNLGLAKIYSQIARMEDVALVSSYKLLSGGLYGSWLKRDLGIASVTTIFGEIYREKNRYLRERDKVATVVRDCDKFVSCSDHCGRSFGQLGMDVQVETVIYGIDTERFSPKADGAGIKSKLGIQPDSKVALYLARMVPEMGLQVFLDMAQDVLTKDPSAAVIVAGATGSLTAAAHQFASRFGGRAFIFPDVPNSDIPDLYAASDVVVVPSINERACLGLTIAEGMATGKPVVAARVGGHPEILHDGASGILVAPQDAGETAAAVRDLFNDDERRKRMGAYGLDFARRCLDRSLTNKRMEEIFTEVLSNRRSATR